MKKVKSILVTAIWLAVISVKAHQADISSLTMIERQGQWMLQLNAAATAFQYEVRHAYGEDAYATADEFNQLLLKHLKQQLTIEVNGKDVTIGKGMVHLGHSTTVAFELTGVPGTLEQIFVENKGFKNIHHSQVVFNFVKEGSENVQYILTEENNFQIHLTLEDDQVWMAESSWKDHKALMASSAIVAVALGSLFFYLHTGFRKTTITS